MSALQRCESSEWAAKRPIQTVVTTCTYWYEHTHTQPGHIEWVDPVAIASLYADWSKVFAGEDQLQQRLTRFLYAMLHILRVLPSSNDCENAHGLPGVKTISKIIVIVQEERGVYWCWWGQSNYLISIWAESGNKMRHVLQTKTFEFYVH